MFLKTTCRLLSSTRLHVLRTALPTRSFKLSSIYAQEKNVLSFDDTRIQKHIDFIKHLNIQDFKSEENLLSHHGMTFEVLRYILSYVAETDSVREELKDLEVLIEDSKGQEKELLDEAIELKTELELKLKEIQNEILQLIVPMDIADDCDIIMELAAGVGGQEAMLFTQDLFRMYCNYANFKGWAYEVMKYDDTGLGGVRNAHISISGHGAFKLLKFECGVHRVQRVPKTEKTGRIHTSTMTVAVLPQPSEIEIIIKPADIEIEFKRSGGAGGQHVNTTDSCVRIKHKATGIVTESQMQRNQHQNRELAMKALRAKLYERQLEAITKETNSNRKLQIGSAGRSEKIRTYNMVQDRITDHRAHITVHGVESLLEGRDDFEHLSSRIQEWSNIQSLNDILQKYDSK